MENNPFVSHGKVGAVQFEGWGQNSGAAYIRLNRNAPDEATYLLGITNDSDGTLKLFEMALNAMWSQATVELHYNRTANLPIITDIILS